MTTSDQGAGEPDPDPRAFSRRSFLKGAGGAAAGSVFATGLAGREAEAEPGRRAVARVDGEVELSLDINGTRQKVKVEPRTTLLNALRGHCDPPLTGAKLVCDQGSCGACTVLIDGKPRYSCMTLALDAKGKQVRTVEGLAAGGELTPLQEAFCARDASMCGFCTPGFLMSLTGVLEKNPRATDEEIKRGCSGNLCRCGTYPFIFDAARDAGARMAKEGGR